MESLKAKELGPTAASQAHPVAFNLMVTHGLLHVHSHQNNIQSGTLKAERENERAEKRGATKKNIRRRRGKALEESAAKCKITYLLMSKGHG